MKTGFIQFAIIALAGTLAVAQDVPPAPAAPPAVPDAVQSAPVAPAPPAKPARVRPAQTPRAPRPPRPPAGQSYLGVDISDVTPERSAELKLKQPAGVEITMVDQDAPAGKAGLKEHDVILSFNGKPVQHGSELRDMIHDTAPGSTVALGISRDGQNQTVNVKLAGRAVQAYVYRGKPLRIEIPRMDLHIPDIDIPNFAVLQYSKRNGLMVENLSPQLGDYFGVRNGEGVLVRSVEKGSAAATAGFRAGDVIVRAANERVLEMSDWSRVLHDHASGTLPVTVVREKREQTLSLNVPAHSSSNESILTIPEGDMEGMRVQIERLGPEFQREQALMAQRLQRELREHQKEWQNNQQQWHREMEKAQRELQRSLRQMQRDLNHLNDDQD